VRQPQLRWPIPADLNSRIAGKRIHDFTRRGKYLLLRINHGHVMIHLGMSGSLRIVRATDAPKTHDHVDWVFAGGKVMRFHDPRRFGSVLWVDGDVGEHPLLRGLGPEPLGDDFCGQYLYERSRRRKVSVKSFIMNSQVVVGVGNIYASESLFQARISPLRAAGRVSFDRYERLALVIREILSKSIEAGGTTLRDFVNSDGNPGYFSQDLSVYGRENAPCHQCRKPLRRVVIGQRSTYYCPRCQH
jgi:formamidopyrimidine-DNA glycosylase